jgi:hypothetical protein
MRPTKSLLFRLLLVRGVTPLENNRRWDETPRIPLDILAIFCGLTATLKVLVHLGILDPKRRAGTLKTGRPRITNASFQAIFRR